MVAVAMVGPSLNVKSREFLERWSYGSERLTGGTPLGLSVKKEAVEGYIL